MTCPFDLWPAPLEVRTRYHVTVSVDYILHASDDELEEMFIDGDTKRPLTPSEVRAQAVCDKAAGRSHLPPCDHTEPSGLCAGHPIHSPPAPIQPGGSV